MLRALLLHCVCLSVSAHGLLQELEEGGLLLELLDQGGVECILSKGPRALVLPHNTHTHLPGRGGGSWVCTSLNGAAVCGRCVSDRESKDMMSILCDTIVFITDDIISFKKPRQGLPELA